MPHKCHLYLFFLCCQPNCMVLKYITSKLHISILIKWCTGIINNRAGIISDVHMLSYLLNPIPTSYIIWLEKPRPASTIQFSYWTMQSLFQQLKWSSTRLPPISGLQSLVKMITSLYYLSSLCASSNQDLNCSLRG